MSAERLVGLDIGTHRIGVAVSDELQIVASPEGTIHISQKNNGIDLAITDIVALVTHYEARRIIVGLPRNMKGESGVQAVWTKEFVDRLRAMLNPLNVYISFVDEQLTTALAARTFQQPQGRSRGAWSTDDRLAQQKTRNRSRPTRPGSEGRSTLDARAAALILQTYLDRRRNQQGTSDRE